MQHSVDGDVAKVFSSVFLYHDELSEGKSQSQLGRKLCLPASQIRGSAGVLIILLRASNIILTSVIISAGPSQ